MKNMKIVLIHGQNHKGNTWNTANVLVNAISCEKEVREFFLPRELNKFCLGCFKCLEGRELCPFWEEKKALHEAIIWADLVILTTPNYCMMPSAPMKAFIDLFFTYWLSHRPQEEMFSKRAVVISTAAGTGAPKAAKLAANCLANWGIPQVTAYGQNVHASSWETMLESKKSKITKDMEKLGKKLSQNKPVRVGAKTRVMFWFFGVLQKKNWGASPAEKEYWESKGWLSGKKPWKRQN